MIFILSIASIINAYEIGCLNPTTCNYRCDMGETCLTDRACCTSRDYNLICGGEDIQGRCQSLPENMSDITGAECK